FIMTPADKKKLKMEIVNEPKDGDVKAQKKHSKAVETRGKQHRTPEKRETKSRNHKNKPEKKARKSSPKKREIEIEPKYKVRRERNLIKRNLK
ncbi:hypothetical protein MXB_4378, partial [Myxobolus squamalis]